MWSDLLTGLERVGDHCSNIAGCVIDLHHHDMNIHQAIHDLPQENSHFADQYRAYTEKYNQMVGRVEADIWYMEHWSFLLDLFIIYKTFANVIKGEKEAY